MFSNLAKYYNVSDNLTEKEKYEIIMKSIRTQIQNEKNFFNFLSFLGINTFLKLIKINTGVKYNRIMSKLYHFFEDYCFNKSEIKSNYNQDIINLVEKNIKLSELIAPLVEKKIDKDLIYYFYVIYIEDKLFFLLILLCLINNKMKILFEYKNKSFSSLIDLDRVIISFKEEVFSKIKNNLSNKKILHIKLINDNFSFSIEDIGDNNKDIKLTNEFELATIKGDKKLHKIINIKSYIKTMENNLDPDYVTDLMTKVNNYEKEIELLKKAIEDHENKINLLNTEIERLKKIENENNKLRGRFVFKGFIDYVFLLFDIEINKKYEEKYELLKENVKKNKINFRRILHDSKY